MRCQSVRQHTKANASLNASLSDHRKFPGYPLCVCAQTGTLTSFKLSAIIHNLGRRLNAIKPRPQVLYVDDDADSREMLSTLLKFRRIDTKAVGTAAQALSLSQTERFDLYLLDGWLPDLDGFELCRQLRSNDPDTPILFFSSAAYEADRTRGLEAGANAYLTKPDVEDLLAGVAKFISYEKDPAELSDLPWTFEESLSPSLPVKIQSKTSANRRNRLTLVR